MDNNQQKVAGQAYLHTREAAAFVPFLQSFFTGLLIALLVFTFLMVARVYFWDALLWSLVVWMTVFTLVWLGLQFHWFSLTNLEKLTGVDINRDGVIASEPAPRENRRTVQVVDIHEVTPNGHLRVTTARFPVPEWMMVELANGLLAEKPKPFSERQWTGKNGPFTQTQFDDLRDEMMRRRLIKPRSAKSSNVGYELTASGRAVMQDFANRSPTPPARSA